jgi:hypothetical protein
VITVLMLVVEARDNREINIDLPHRGLESPAASENVHVLEPPQQTPRNPVLAPGKRQKPYEAS